MTLRPLFTLLLLAALAAKSLRANSNSLESAPKKVGVRTAVVEFSYDQSAKASDIRVVETESRALSDLGQALIKVGRVKPDSEGVTKVAANSYRLLLSYPVPNDGARFPANVSLPVPAVRQAPTYPFGFRRDGVTGGVLLRLTFDEKGKIKKVESVHSSDPAFTQAALNVVKSWKYGKPAMKDGIPIPITVLQLLTFQIGGDNPKLAPLLWRISPEPCLDHVTVEGSFSPVRPR